VTAFSSHGQFLSWGRVEREAQEIAAPHFLDELQGLLSEPSNRSLLAVGLGRSYGDSCLNGGQRMIDMTGLDRLIALDSAKGVVQAEAGLALGDLLREIVPRGWFTTTTPGTRHVTLGGLVANDVHGKNHHRAGSFGCGVKRLGLLRSDRGQLDVTAEEGSDLFRATVGGLGLTGIITSVELALTPIRSAYLDVERVAFGHVRDFFRIAAESAESHEHTVAWIDGTSSGAALGRGIFQRARWLEDGNLRPHSESMALAMPFETPGALLNPLIVRAFNSLYYHLQKSGSARLRMHYAPFFYPLDKVRHWNRLYGGRGFYQYQCLVPSPVAESAIEELLREISRSGAASVLSVLKTLGSERSPGMLSFAREGTTLALDFANRGASTLALLGRLDTIVQQAGGHLYPAKDGRMPAEMFRAGYPEWQNFERHIDPRFSSNFWRRVVG
jgi:FAD/FMN-containing dehydrogenase